VAEGEFTLLHPVERVSWTQAREFAFRLDLKLPDEDEWEFACRAGARTAYYWGDSPDGLARHENIFDESVGPNAPPSIAPWDDHFVRHAPIGWFLPNGYGLFDMLGNVSEWCAEADPADPISALSSEAKESTGITMRFFRGGSWGQPPRMGEIEPNRCAFRQRDAEPTLVSFRGLRVARECRQP
jgi:formylglycine-generating enzyme required for sulfatase activity